MGRLKLLNIWILRLNNIVNYTMTFYRKFLATEVQHFPHIFWHMFRAENLVPNFISAPISGVTAVQSNDNKERNDIPGNWWGYINLTLEDQKSPLSPRAKTISYPRMKLQPVKVWAMLWRPRPEYEVLLAGEIFVSLGQWGGREGWKWIICAPT